MQHSRLRNKSVVPIITKLAGITSILAMSLLNSATAETIETHPVSGNPMNWCRLGGISDSMDIAQLATVTDGAAAATYDGNRYPNINNKTLICPSDNPLCLNETKLRPGVEVIALHDWRDFTCVIAPEKPVVYWVSSQRIQRHVLPDSAPSQTDWHGYWADHYNRLQIEPQGEKLGVEGEAFWVGPIYNEETGERGVNLGEIEAEFIPVGNQAVVGDDNEDDLFNCKVTMVLLGDYLLVDDNRQCGGANVTFQGLYQKPQPSFNCNLATTVIEKTICATPELAHLDKRVADAYQMHLLWGNSNPDVVRAEQRQWLKARNKACPTGNVECLQRSYHNRLFEL